MTMGEPKLLSRRCPNCNAWTFEEDYYACECPSTFPCPECDERIEAEYCLNQSEPKDCLDHMTEDDLRDEARTARAKVTELEDKLKKMESRARYKEAHLKEYADGVLDIEQMIKEFRAL